MRRSGKVHVLVPIGIICALGLVGASVFLQGSDSPTKCLTEFMNALGRADVDGVMRTSTYGDEPREELRKKWELCFHRAEYYRFTWRIAGVFTPTPEDAVIAVDVYRNVGFKGASQQRVQVPVTQVDGKWLVDAESLDRNLFPALPR